MLPDGVGKQSSWIELNEFGRLNCMIQHPAMKEIVFHAGEQKGVAAADADNIDCC